MIETDYTYDLDFPQGWIEDDFVGGGGREGALVYTGCCSVSQVCIRFRG